MPYLIIIFSLLLSQLSQCTSTPPTEPTDYEEEIDNKPSRRQSSIGAAWENEDWLLVLATKNETEKTNLKEVLQEIAAAPAHGRNIQLVELQDLTTTVLGGSSIILVGDDFPDEVWSGLGATNGKDVRGYDLSGQNWSASAFYAENPWSGPDTSIAMHFHYSTDLAKLNERLRQRYRGQAARNFLRGRYGYLINEGDEARVKGFFSDVDWRPDPEQEIIFQPAGEPVYADNKIRIYAPEGVNDKVLENSISQLRHARGRLYEWFKIIDSLPVLDVHLYPTLERLSLRHQRMAEVQFNESDHSIQLATDAAYDNLRSRELYYCMLRWASTQGAIPPTEEYLDRARSTIYADEFLIDQDGIAELEQQKLLPKLEELKNLDRASFGSYLYDYAAAVRSYEQLATDNRLGKKLTPTRVYAGGGSPFATLGHRMTQFQKGMTFAHEGYRIYNGYGGGTVDASLDSLSKLGVNSIAVVPYTFQRNARQVGELPISDSAGSENNAATRSSARRARARGWSVMLKPQIWVGGGSWPGDIDFDTQAEWDRWFKRYTQWILNYALLAQAERIETLCIGTELRFATLKQPEKWRNLIRAVRSVYDGQLTYAANWGEEFENITFWPELDVIGLNSYYPLSEHENVSDEELLKGAGKWVTMADKVATLNERPWWLTEVGYRSVENAWLNPHADAGERPEDETAQARCYLALITALNEADRFSGMYVWKWPSYLGRGERREKKIGFTPGGKVAGEILRKYYGG